jgi:type IV fimbrial biogenesis protein FimT
VLRQQKGVTLIELMIGLTVSAILLALAVPNFSIFIQNTRIRNAAEAIQNGLALARSEAVRRNANVQFVLGSGSSWTVGCETDTTECPASIQSRSAAEGSADSTITTSEVASDGTITTPATFTDTLGFNGLGRVVPSTLPAGSNAVFDVMNASGSSSCAVSGGAMRCLQVIVSSGGQVRMCDPKLSASNPTDPQAC